MSDKYFAAKAKNTKNICSIVQSKMQARQTKNSSMKFNLSFCPLAADALVSETPFVVTCDATFDDDVVTSSFFRRPKRGFFCCRCPGLENRIP